MLGTVALAGTTTLANAWLVCSVCGRTIRGQYIESGGRVFCSERCYQTILPRCERCGKSVEAWIEINGRVFCETCAKSKPCWSCRLPFNDTRGFRIADGRRVCRDCAEQAIRLPRDVEPIYDRAIQQVAALTGFLSQTRPELKLVDLRGMAEATGLVLTADDRTYESGLYVREEKTPVDAAGRPVGPASVRETIYILSWQRRSAALATLSHELTHDLFIESFPRLRDLSGWLPEGVCQYVSAMVLRRARLLEELREIEEMADPVYGDGYRALRDRFGENNWAAMSNWLASLDPRQLPRRPEDLRRR